MALRLRFRSWLVELDDFHITEIKSSEARGHECAHGVCAGHARQLRGESPPYNLVEVKY